MDETLILDVMDRRAKRRMERRDLFRLAGGVAAGAGAMALAGCGGGHSASTAVTATDAAPTDADVLNFALNLEYLEANFYHYAVYGTPLDPSMLTGTGTQGSIQGGQKVPFASPVVQRLATEIANDEMNHVVFLRSQLGASAVAEPAIDVSVSPTSAFSQAAQSAGLVPAGTAFNPYANDESFLLGAYLFEDVGVTAYIGGSGVLINNKVYLEAAAGILAVEAYHASIIRQTLYNLGINGPGPLGVGAAPIDPFAATAAISAARAKLDGTGTDDIGIGTAAAPTVVDANKSNGLAFVRTTAQVLNIVYLNAASVSAGGFFPNGMNGNIRTSG